MSPKPSCVDKQKRAPPGGGGGGSNQHKCTISHGLTGCSGSICLLGTMAALQPMIHSGKTTNEPGNAR